MRLKWSRVKADFGTDYCSGEYRIERFEDLAGARYIWILTGPAGEQKHMTLRKAKWAAQRHAQTETPAAESTDAR